MNSHGLSRFCNAILEAIKQNVSTKEVTYICIYSNVYIYICIRIHIVYIYIHTHLGSISRTSQHRASIYISLKTPHAGIPWHGRKQLVDSGGMYAVGRRNGEF